MGDPSTLRPAFTYPLPQEGRVSPVFIPWDCCVTLGHFWLSLSRTEGKEGGKYEGELRTVDRACTS